MANLNDRQIVSGKLLLLHVAIAEDDYENEGDPVHYSPRHQSWCYGTDGGYVNFGIIHDTLLVDSEDLDEITDWLAPRRGVEWFSREKDENKMGIMQPRAEDDSHKRPVSSNGTVMWSTTCHPLERRQCSGPVFIAAHPRPARPENRRPEIP
jgi:hypothetical protein